VLVLAFSVDTSRCELAEDHEIAFWCVLICVWLKFAFSTLPQKYGPQAGELYLIRDLRIKQSVCVLSLKYEKFTFLFFFFPSSPTSQAI